MSLFTILAVDCGDLVAGQNLRPVDFQGCSGQNHDVDHPIDIKSKTVLGSGNQVVNQLA